VKKSPKQVDPFFEKQANPFAAAMLLLLLMLALTAVMWKDHDLDFLSLDTVFCQEKSNAKGARQFCRPENKYSYITMRNYFLHTLNQFTFESFQCIVKHY
jgi:hypothetical protein